MRWSALLVVLLVAACADTGTREPAQREFAVPDRMLGYTYSGGTYRPIPNTGTGIVSGSSLQSAY
jgi:hypothetical protein